MTKFFVRHQLKFARGIVITGITAIVMLSVMFILQGSGTREVPTVTENNYNASEVFTSGAFLNDDQAISVNKQLNKFMAKHPNGKVEVTSDKNYYIAQYSYHKD